MNNKENLPNPIRNNKNPDPKTLGEAKYDINTIEDAENQGITAKYEGGQFTYNLDITRSSKIDWSKHPLELRGTKGNNTLHKLTRTEASHVATSKTSCDGCGKTLSSYSSKPQDYENVNTDSGSNYGAIQLYLRDPKNNSYDTLHACDAACMHKALGKHLQKKKEFLEQELAKHQDINKESDACGDDSMASKKKLAE